MTFSFLRLAFSLRPGFNNALVDYVFSYYSPLLGVESFSGVWMVDVSCELCRGCACVCRQPALRWFGSTSHHLVRCRKCIFILFHCLLRVIPSTSSSRQLLLLVVGCCCCFSLATLALIVEIGGISSCSTSSEKLISFLVPSSSSSSSLSSSYPMASAFSPCPFATGENVESFNPSPSLMKGGRPFALLMQTSRTEPQTLLSIWMSHYSRVLTSPRIGNVNTPWTPRPLFYGIYYMTKEKTFKRHFRTGHSV